MEYFACVGGEGNCIQSCCSLDEGLGSLINVVEKDSSYSTLQSKGTFFLFLFLAHFFFVSEKSVSEIYIIIFFVLIVLVLFWFPSNNPLRSPY